MLTSVGDWLRSNRWTALAACKNADPDLFEQKADGGRPWKPYCDACPVQKLCLQAGLDEDARINAEISDKSRGHRSPMIWGGKTVQQRGHMHHLEKGRLRQHVNRAVPKLKEELLEAA
jgi:Transcription factor WhiB